MAIGATLMNDIISKSPVPIYKGDLVEPKPGNSQGAGFSRGTYNKDFDNYRQWI